MKFEEILGKLKEAANFDMTKTETGWTGHGAINNFKEWVIPDNKEDLLDIRMKYPFHYEKCKRILESLPWTKEVQNPRVPEPDEYPDKDGNYITMLDCDEHAVWCNRFRDGSWTVYNRTHVKWWMPIPENFEIK